MKIPTSYAHSQNGTVLIVSLIILLVMTLIGITALSTTNLEEKMAGNLRNQNLALQAAMSALRAGETTGEALLVASVLRPTAAATCPSPPCDFLAFSAVGNVVAQTPAWWSSQGKPLNGLSQLSAPPNFVIEERGYLVDSLVSGQGNAAGRFVYRISARGTGGTNDAQAVVQETFIYKKEY